MTAPHVTTNPIPALAASVATAQAAGDRAYAEAQARGATPEQLYDAYHRAYAIRLWLQGGPSACACQFCQWLNAADADEASGDDPTPAQQRHQWRDYTDAPDLA